MLMPGCMVHKPSQDIAPRVSSRDMFHQAPVELATPFPLDQPWWESFGDPVLNQLVEDALEQNLGLQQLVLRIEQAQALHRQAGARLFPALGGAAGYDSIWRDLDDSNRTLRNESASVGVLLDWELDVWGRLRSAKGAQAQELEATYHDWLGGRLILAALVAETYFETVEQREQLRLLNRQIDVNTTLLELNRLRFGQGQSSIVDVLQQREQLASTRALVPTVEAREGALRYILDVLLGQAPGSGEWDFGVVLANPPGFDAAGVPADLLANRPDLMAAQSRITGLDYRVGEAIADRLPRFEIGGALTAVGDPSFNSLVGSAFGSIVGPIFDAGERRAVVAQRRAVLEAAVMEFSEDYLAAVRDVEIALLAERKRAEAVALEEEQLEIAQDLLGETRNRYSQGLTDYLPVLAAVTTEQNLQRELIRSRRELLSARVALHRSLGGPMSAPPELTSIDLSDE